MFNVYRNQLSRQTGSRNLTGPFNIHLYMHIFLRIFLSNYWWQESDIWSQSSYRYAILWEAFLEVQKRFPRYGLPIWSLWPNIRFLPSIVAEKNVTKNVHICSMCIKTYCTFFVAFFSATIDDRNLIFGHKLHIGMPYCGKRFWTRQIPTTCLKNVTKNEHICSMCRKINKVGKQEVAIWWFQKRFPRYGVPIWSLSPNIRSLPSIVAEKNVTWQESDIWSQASYRYAILWEAFLDPSDSYYLFADLVGFYTHWNIRFLPSIVAEKNVTKNVHICSMCIKTY
jgi:hypothetical protein